MHKKIAYLFPGQGSQVVGMGKEFWDQFSIAQKTYQEADDLLQYNLSEVIFAGPSEVLKETRHSQLALFVTSVAVLRVIQEQIPELFPSFAAGLSLGEYTALFASGRLSFQETLFLIEKRARFMQEACVETKGAMAAVLGLSSAKVQEGLLGIKGVWIANDNAPDQIVISGTEGGVEKGMEALNKLGAKRTITLEVYGAFHSPLMESAKQKLAPFLRALSLERGDVPLVMNVSGAFVEEENIRDLLIQQVTEPVRWHQGILAIEERGVDLYLEIGCGKTLTGLNRKIGVEAKTVAIEKVKDLDTLGMGVEA